MKLIKDISIESNFSFDEEKKIDSWQAFCETESILMTYYDVRLSDLSKLNEISRESIKNWITKKNKSMIFFGGVGCGKTHCSLALLRWAYENVNKWVRYLTAEKLLHEGREHGPDYLRKKYGECPFLIIDDLGVEKPPAWETQYLFAVCDERIGRGNQTIITTNLDQNALEIMYTKRPFSRLQADWVKFNDIDRREIQ